MKKILEMLIKDLAKHKKTPPNWKGFLNFQPQADDSVKKYQPIKALT